MTPLTGRRIVRHTSEADIPAVLALYDGARLTMRENGNPNQWPGAYPGMESLRLDMERGVSYVMECEGVIIGSFALVPGLEPTYSKIYDGNWDDEDLPYSTIHRLAGSRQARGVAATCFSWCRKQALSLRADTHRDNTIMQHALGQAGFIRRGIIFLRDGSERIAYQWTGSKSG